jgi:hypothetical protein
LFFVKPRTEKQNFVYQSLTLLKFTPPAAFFI